MTYTHRGQAASIYQFAAKMSSQKLTPAMFRDIRLVVYV